MVGVTRIARNRAWASPTGRPASGLEGELTFWLNEPPEDGVEVVTSAGVASDIGGFILLFRTAVSDYKRSNSSDQRLYREGVGDE